MANGMPMIVPGAHLPSAAGAGSRSHGGKAAAEGEETPFSTVLRRTAQRLRSQVLPGEDALGAQEPGAPGTDGMNGAMPGDGTWVMPWLAADPALVGSSAESADAAGGSGASAIGGPAGQASEALMAGVLHPEEGEGSTHQGGSTTSAIDSDAASEAGLANNGRVSAGHSVAAAPSPVGTSHVGAPAGSGVTSPAVGGLPETVQSDVPVTKPAVAAAAGGEAPGHGPGRNRSASNAGTHGAGKTTMPAGDVQRMIAAPPAFGSGALQTRGRVSLAAMTPRARAYALRAQAAAETEPREAGTVRAGGLLFAAPEAMEGPIVHGDGEEMAAQSSVAAEGEAADPSLRALAAPGSRGGTPFPGKTDAALSKSGQAFTDGTSAAGPQASQPDGTAAPSAAKDTASPTGQGFLPSLAGEAQFEGTDGARTAPAKGHAATASPVVADPLGQAHPLQPGTEAEAGARSTAHGAASPAVTIGERGLSSEGSAAPAVAGKDGAAASSATANGAAVTEGAPAFAGVSSPWMPQPTFNPLGQAAAAPGESVPTAHALAEDIVRMSFSAGNGETQEATLQLHPEHLGRLAVKVLVEEGRVHVHMVAEQEAASSLLKAQLSLLRDALGEHGLRLEHVHVDTAPGDESAFSFFSSGTGREGGWPAERGFAGEALGRQGEDTGGSSGIGLGDGDGADDGETASRTAPLDGYRLNVRV